jgi:hypothetical protein
MFSPHSPAQVLRGAWAVAHNRKGFQQMIVLYLSLLALLAVLHVLLRWRASGLEQRYIQVSAEADALLKQASTKGGNTNKPDPYQAARQQYELALVVMRRDDVERAYMWWQGAAERFGSWVSGLLSYKGRVLPYLMGVVDVAAVVFVLAWLKLGLPQLQALVGLGG